MPYGQKLKIHNLDWGTLCHIYFVTASTTRLLWGYCTVKYNTFEIILEKREFSCIKKTCMHVATREFKYTLTYFLVLTTFPSSISHSFLHNLETYSYYSAMWETEHIHYPQTRICQSISPPMNGTNYLIKIRQTSFATIKWKKHRSESLLKILHIRVSL